MMNNIAVILRGHLRTWDYLYPAIFDFYDAIAKNVEYYFVTWNIYTEHRINLVRQNFAGKNLITLCKVQTDVPPPCHMPLPGQPNLYKFSSWTGPGWLSNSLIHAKQQREQHIKYDAVFDTRPDIIYTLIDGKSIICPDPMTLYTTEIMLLTERGETNVGIADHFFMMQSNVYDIISQRYTRMTPFGSHVEFKRVCDENNINVCKLDWIDGQITRPNSKDMIPDPRDYFNNKKTNTSWAGVQEEWMKMTSAEKRACVNKHNLNVDDYITSSPFASIN